MKLAIIGSRTATDYTLLTDYIDRWFGFNLADDGSERGHLVDEVISGGAAGADTLGARWAKDHGVKLTVFKPDWERYGKRAGFLRNEDIVKAADMVLALWDGVSKGTANSLSIAKRLKKPTLIVYF